ncbi:MAG: hypothetical protein GY823_07925 [Flavobacteriaceae bacterium]|nr:hypothetical protein [Flavobacteriaceae bacterium]|tara:strand:- start:4226 stop:4408 length:183 start_codon:yes stop_codon:yes gene_type:complete
MRKKMITAALSLILLSGCGASKVPADECCTPKTEQEHHEGVMNGVLFALITYAIFSVVKL